MNSQKIKTVIIEDEQVSYLVLRQVLTENFPEIEIIGNSSSVNSAYDLILISKPDLVFLDVQLEGGSGFALLEKFEYIDFSIIFVTSYNQYAIKAIKWSALDYILKPVNPDELHKAINKLKKINNLQNTNLKTDTLLENIKHSKDIISKGKIVLPTNEEYHIVSVDDIIRCQADNYYTKVFLNNGKQIMVSKTLKEYEQLLSDSGFIRTHNSHLINIKYIKTFVRLEGGYIVMTDSTIIPVSRRRKNMIVEMLNNI